MKWSATLPGVRLEWRPGGACYLQAGAYDGDALDHPAGELTRNAAGTRLQLNGDQGVFAIAEFGFRLNRGDEASGLPGTYKIGGSYQSSEFEDLYYDRNGDSWVVSGMSPRSYSGNGLFYFAAEQRVYREPGGIRGDEGLGAFFRIGAGSANRNPVSWVLGLRTGLVF